jgi:ComF family protein
MLAEALDVVFPRRCAGCAAGPWPFCAACRATLVPLEPPWCDRCGRPAPVSVPVCGECPPGPLASTRAAFRYEGAAKAAILRLKFAGWRDVATAFGAAIAAGDVPEADVVTWVPLSRRRRAERGYDQARAIAVSVARELDRPMQRLVRRSLRTEPQARRAAGERREAMRGAFVAFGPLASARVLLVDDVLTTGATLAACADALVSSGVGSVHGAVAARSFSPRSVSRGRSAALHAPRQRAYSRTGPRPGLWLPEDPPR